MKHSRPIFLTSIEASHIERFWEKVDAQPSGCWVWKAQRRGGYGIFRFYNRHIKAHRFASVVATGKDWNAAEQGCHSCDTPFCIRPEHVHRGTGHQNIAESIARGRRPGRSVTTEDLLQIQALKEQGLSAVRIGHELNISSYYVSQLLAGKRRQRDNPMHVGEDSDA